MVHRSASLMLLLVACGSPIGPIATDLTFDSDVVRLETLRDGQRLVVDFHAQGCFMSSDATLVFESSGGQVQLSGSLSVSGLREASPTPFTSRQLTRTELVQLDNMLDLYRREEHQTHCWSTGKHKTTLRLSNTDGSTHTEHYDVDGCIEYNLLGQGDFFEMRPRENMLFFNDLTFPVLQQMFARRRGGAA